MTEADFPKPPGVSTGSIPDSGDPSLELFGQGWLPPSEQTADAESYTGKHRAPEA